MTQKALIILMKNPEKGQVKTRLAKAIGEDKALEVYIELLKHAREITKPLDCERYVFYSSKINLNDDWNSHKYEKFVQNGPDLGERMKNAFKVTLKKNNKVLLIVTDCYELSSEIIEEAFEKLDDHDIVIGPDVDGGYYLIGMKKLYPQLFENKKWSTETVCSDTLNDVKTLNLSCAKLQYLSDIDTLEDLMKSTLSELVKMEK